MQKGWFKDKGKWYFLCKDGSMATGWKNLNNYWFYFRTATDEDGENEGVNVKNSWYNISGIWYYFESNGQMATEWKYIGDCWYYLGSDGKMVVGWKRINNNWYYFNSDGKMRTGWLDIADSTDAYYFNMNSSQGTKGAMVSNETRTINNVCCKFASNGKLTEAEILINHSASVPYQCMGSAAYYTGIFNHANPSRTLNDVTVIAHGAPTSGSAAEERIIYDIHYSSDYTKSAFSASNITSLRDMGSKIYRGCPIVMIYYNYNPEHYHAVVCYKYIVSSGGFYAINYDNNVSKYYSYSTLRNGGSTELGTYEGSVTFNYLN